MSKKQTVQLSNARVGEQRDIMEQIIRDGLCPFCPENLKKYHKRPILFETEKWIVTENAWPYKLTKKQFLVIYKEHIEHNSQISPEGWSDIHEVMKKLEKDFNLEYGTLMMRFGDPSLTGATVRHLHFHLIQSDPENPNYDPKKGLWTRVG